MPNHTWTPKLDEWLLKTCYLDNDGKLRRYDNGPVHATRPLIRDSKFYYHEVTQRLRHLASTPPRNEPTKLKGSRAQQQLQRLRGQ